MEIERSSSEPLTMLENGVVMEVEPDWSQDRQFLSEAESGAVWPLLPELGIGRELEFVRRAGIGGSDANVILSGDDDRILRLWREKRGELAPENLSHLLPVMLGTWTEEFNRQWYEKLSGLLVNNAGASLACDRLAWRRCTLDGYVPARKAVFEAKHVNAFAKPDEVLARYMPQLQHNMAVVKADLAILSVIFGNHKFEIYEVAADWLYQDELLIAESRFWDCVRCGTPPVAAPVPQVPVPVGFREICFDGNNAWAVAASDWLELRVAAKRHKVASASLKELVTQDVARAYGHGVEIKRSKSGALTILEHRA